MGQSQGDKRPHRAGRGGFVDLVQINGSSWGPIRTWLETHHRQRVVAIGQEHRLLPEACEVVEASMRNSGWRMGFAPALRTTDLLEQDAGLCSSAGAMVAAPMYIGFEPLQPHPNWDLSPVGATGRLAAGWANVLGGIAVLSAYFWCSERWSCRNQALMRRIIEVVQDLDCLWVLSADFNMELEEFWGHHLAWELDGLLVRPDRGTCFTPKTKEWKCYDFFFVDRRLEHSIESVEVMMEADTTPHLPVRLRLRASAKGLVRRAQKQPKQLPERPPIGCARKPPEWPELPDALGAQEQADELWKGIAGCLEREMLDVSDIVGDEAGKYEGRGKTPRWILQPVRPQRLHNHPRASADARTWRWIARRLAEVWILGHVVASGGNASAGQKCQLVGLRGALFDRASALGPLGEHAGEWACTLLTVACSDFQTYEGLTWLAARQTLALAQASSAEGRDRCVARTEYGKFLQQAGQGAAGLLHKLSKPVTIWRPRGGAPQGGGSCPSAAADQAASKWGAIWQVGDEEAQEAPRPWLAPLPPEEEPLLALREQRVEFRSVCRAFKARTGLGVDRVHPHLWGRTSDEGVDTVLGFLDLVEDSLLWPSQLMWLFYHLIPKVDGGDRPIGVLAAIVRAWEGLRMPVMNQWLRSIERDYDWAAAGRSAEQAVWEQLVHAEALDADDDSPGAITSATLLLDLVKCFDRLRLEHVWRWGCYWGAPRRLLRVILVVFSFCRRLVVEKSFSVELRTITAIVAGSRFSCAILHMVLVWPCDRLLALWPSVSLAKFVDDLSLRVQGCASHVADVVPRVLDNVIDMTKSLDLEVSRGTRWVTGGKTKALVSHTSLWKRLEVPLRRRGVALVSGARNLGVDHRAAKAGGCKTRLARFALLRRRGRILSGLRRAGAKQTRKVVNCGFKPSLTFGARCMGLPKSQVQWLRRTMSACLPGRHRGRSTTLRLAVYRSDLIHECREAPIGAWAAAVWDARIDASVLQDAWRRQMPAVGLRPSWRRVRGPCGACVMHLGDIGWAWPRWDTFVSRDGHQMNLAEICPQDVKAMVMLDSDAALWAEWALDDAYSSLRPRPLIEPVASLIAARCTAQWTTEMKNAAAAVFQGGSWTQDRMCASGLADTELCQLCGAIGTPHHRLHCCVGYRGARSGCPATYQHIAEEADPSNLLWTRGLAVDPSSSWHFRPVSENGNDIVWRASEADSGPVTFSGRGFTDGSLMRKTRTGGQTGWAAIERRCSANEATVVMYGVLPVSLPVQRRILRAELWALWRILVHCLPPLRIYIDNAAVVEGVHKGRKWCCAAARPHADVWRRIWIVLSDVGLGDQGIDIQKCKSHISKAARAELGAVARDIAKGNDEVDSYAKSGAAMDDMETCRAQALADAGDKVQGALKFIGALAVHARVDGAWTDTTPWPPKAERLLGADRIRPVRAPPSRPHAEPFDRTDGGGVRCRVCQCEASARRAGTFRRSECRGPVAALMAGQVAPGRLATVNNHVLMKSAPYVWCSKCGAHTRKRLGLLAKQCRRIPGSRRYRMCCERLAQGKDPVTGALLPDAEPQRLTSEEWQWWTNGRVDVGVPRRRKPPSSSRGAKRRRLST